MPKQQVVVPAGVQRVRRFTTKLISSNSEIFETGNCRRSQRGKGTFTAAWGELFPLSYERISRRLELQSKGSSDPYFLRCHQTQEHVRLVCLDVLTVFFRQNSEHA